MQRLKWICSLLVAISLSSLCRADDTNVALNKPVVLNGAFGVIRPNGLRGGKLAPAATVVDGIFPPQHTYWANNNVWWDTTVSAGNTVEVDLADSQGTSAYLIKSFIVQVDDNDEYILEYRDPTGQWKLAWTVPVSRAGAGLETRPNPADNTARYTLPAPVTATALRIRGNDLMSDRYYCVSEIQAFGAQTQVWGARAAITATDTTGKSSTTTDYIVYCDAKQLILGSNVEVDKDGNVTVLAVTPLARVSKILLLNTDMTSVNRYIATGVNPARLNSPRTMRTVELVVSQSNKLQLRLNAPGTPDDGVLLDLAGKMALYGLPRARQGTPFGVQDAIDAFDAAATATHLATLNAEKTVTVSPLIPYALGWRESYSTKSHTGWNQFGFYTDKLGTRYDTTGYSRTLLGYDGGIGIMQLKEDAVLTPRPLGSLPPTATKVDALLSHIYKLAVDPVYNIEAGVYVLCTTKWSFLEPWYQGKNYVIGDATNSQGFLENWYNALWAYDHLLTAPDTGAYTGAGAIYPNLLWDLIANTGSQSPLPALWSSAGLFLPPGKYAVPAKSGGWSAFAQPTLGTDSGAGIMDQNPDATKRQFLAAHADLALNGTIDIELSRAGWRKVTGGVVLSVTAMPADKNLSFTVSAQLTDPHGAAVGKTVTLAAGPNGLFQGKITGAFTTGSLYTAHFSVAAKGNMASGATYTFHYK